MSPRAFAVVLLIAPAAWLAPFLAGCSGAAETETPPVTDAAVAGTGIRYVTHRVQPASDYKRISEYFTGEENTGGNLVARTDAADRRGLYFIFAPDYFAKLPDGAVAVLEFVSAEKVDPKKYLFVLPAFEDAGLFREIRLGVTGKDWPKTNPKVIAWKITLRNKRTGAAFATAQSFLWSFPANPAAAPEPAGKK